MLLLLAATQLTWAHAGCGRLQDPDAAKACTFDSVFETVDRIQLTEDPTDPIGDIGILVEARNGDLIVGDRILPRIRRFEPEGQHLGTFGDFGEGPFEFRVVGGLAEDTFGLLVIDPRLARVTFLTRDLDPDTLFTMFPAPRGPAAPFCVTRRPKV